MSWLMDLIKGRKKAPEVIALSVIYLRTKLGVTVTDAKVDEATAAAKKLGDVMEEAIKAYIAVQAPGLPAAVASMAVIAAFNSIDAAVAGAANVIKANN